MKLTVEQLAGLALQLLEKKSLGFKSLVASMKQGLSFARGKGEEIELPQKRELNSAAYMALKAVNRWDESLGVIDDTGFNVSVALTARLSEADLGGLNIQRAGPSSGIAAQCQVCSNATVLVYVPVDALPAQACCDACLQKLIDASQYGFIHAKFCYYPAAAAGSAWGNNSEDFVALREFIEACMNEHSVTPYASSTTRRGEVIDELLRLLEPLPRNGVQQSAVHRLKVQVPHWREEHPSWIARTVAEQVNWELLAAKGDPWKALVEHYRRLYAKRQQEVDEQRFAAIHKFRPSRVFVGRASFEGYLAFIFDEQKIALLDSMKVGNATYAMLADEWRDLSKLSKTELLREHSRQIVRIIHNPSWLETLERLLGVSKA